MKKIFDEFKTFIAKGNVVDLAVAVVIGGAFGKIVTSLVDDIVMPLISLITGGLSVSDWKWVISEATYDASGNVITAESALKYGNFLQMVIDFFIIAVCIFTVVKLMNSFKSRLSKQKEEVEEEVVSAPVETTEDILKDIRDLLRNKETTEE